MPLPQKEEHYTYADFCKWDDENRWELIDGVAYMMATPLVRHQRILRKLAIILGNFLEGKTCEMLFAPIGVRFNAESEDDTVLQPDIIIVCDKVKIERDAINGAPDMVVEILSPSTARHDRFRKFDVYEKSGVREYWIVDPESKTLQVHILEEGVYDIIRTYRDDDAIDVHILDGCTINLTDVFAD